MSNSLTLVTLRNLNRYWK